MPMNPTTDRPPLRVPMPPPAFHSLRALIPRKAMHRPPAVMLPEPPTHEKRAFPVELTYLS